MKRFKVTGGYAVVSDQDFRIVSQLAWHVSSGGYLEHSKRVGPRRANRQQRILMHQVLCPRPWGTQYEVDHINGNKLDNRRENLRIVDHARNQWNRRKLNRNNKTGYRGVHYRKDKGAYCARIMVHGEQKHLGYFDTAVKAHRAYKASAKELYGQYLGVC